MKINSLEFKNIASYGNKIQRIDFQDGDALLYLLAAGNGAGKCLDKNTEIEVSIENPEVKEKFIEFLKNKNNPL